MSDLDRIKALAGLATDSVAKESAEREMKEQTTNESSFGPTMYQVRDENGQEYDIVKYRGEIVAMPSDPENLMGGGDGPYDYDEENCEIYSIGKCTKINEAVGDSAEPIYDLIDMHFEGDCQPVFDDLVRYLSGDQIKEFVADFRRHHELPMDMDMDEAELDENAFNQAAAAAARAGKEEFEFNGKKYKTTMDKSTAHQLDDDVQVEEFEDEELCDKCDMKADECTCDHVEETPEAEVVSEAPTMDTTQFITLLRNAGLSEEAIETKITEWANTPEGVSETEPTDHGEAYEMAQAVNLSLKKYVDAQDHKVSVTEEKTSTDYKKLYEDYKKGK